MLIKASFDDATIEDLKVANLMKKYDIPTTFYWPVMPKYANENNGRKSLNEEQMQMLAKEFEIGSHTISHPLLTRIKLEDAKTEIVNSRQLLQEKFGQPIDSFCYPRGYSNPAIQQLVVEAGYVNARSTLVGYVHQSENPYFEQTAVHVSCNRKEYAGDHWYAYGMKLFEIAKKVPDSVFHLWGHSWEIEKNFEWLQFEAFLKEITS